MLIYMLYAVCFAIPVSVAFSEGRKQGVLGTFAGTLTGVLVGLAAVFALRGIFRWIARHPHTGHSIPEPVWFVIDVFLCVAFFAAIVGLGFVAAFLTSTLIHYAKA